MDRVTEGVERWNFSATRLSVPSSAKAAQLLELIEIHHDGILLTFQNMKSGLRYP